VRGDLDCIVMKALDKDRNRRYDTANDLAMDIQRHLNNDPVLAGPPSMLYRLTKFVWKHRAGVRLLALLLLMSAAFVLYEFVAFREATVRRLLFVAKIHADTCLGALLFEDTQLWHHSLVPTLVDELDEHIVLASLYHKMRTVYTILQICSHCISTRRTVIALTNRTSSYNLSLIAGKPWHALRSEMGSVPTVPVYLA
jgi:hypothetical protein